MPGRPSLRWNAGSALARPAPPGGSQSAVALTPADGESISGSTQSNFTGNGYWTRRGFTRATSWTGTNPVGGTFTGFDDTDFLPITIWLASVASGDSGFYSRCADLGVNGLFPVYWETPLNEITAGGMWCVVTNPEITSIAGADDPTVVGVSSGEEPSSDAQFDSIAADNASWLAGAEGSGRFALYNFAKHIMNSGGFGGGNSTTPQEMVVAGDFVTSDQYWVAGSTGGASGSQFSCDFDLYEGLGEPTSAQCQRGSHYGSQLSALRHWAPAAPTRPIGVWVENGAPYDDAVTIAISPTQLKWAVWATFVHGARSIHYFNHTFRSGDPGGGFNNFNNNYYGGPGVPGTGIYAAAREVNRNALTIAPVINSPNDGRFLFEKVVYPNAETTGRISEAGFLTAVTSTNSRLRLSGVDASCKWQPTEGKHYILATTREAESDTNIPVTFRMIDQGQTSAVRLFDTTGTIAISRGGAIPGGYCEFSDTFATGASYKAYRID